MSLSGNQRTRLGVGGPSPAYLPIQDKAETVVTINLGHAIRLSKDTKKIILSEGKITHDVINELQLFQMDPPRTGIFLGEAIPGNDYIVYTSSFHDTDVNNENVLTQAGAVFFRDYASDGWTNQIKITAPTREASARFGQVVSISGQNILTN
ncbi:hypothetical protein KAR91_17165, partial [Candidatus Pacearchaeota archaeon]|nr:hypothetical protein [Candidatus Pacearchaeota archaeon]